MKEKDKLVFYDVSALKETENVRSRCTEAYIASRLNEMFPEEKLRVMSVALFENGTYINKSKGAVASLLPMMKIKNLPAFCEIKVDRLCGSHTETIVVWTPLKWNGRFVGCGGGGTSTGGEKYIEKPSNTSRGMNLPKCVVNGFTGATSDSGAKKMEWAFEDGVFQSDLIEKWRAEGTHFMTLMGKAVSEIIHGRKPEYSYFHGGSGGGRQAMVEVQEYPEDYNGIWASCPAINWTKFVIMGLWFIALMNSKNHIVSNEKMKAFLEAAQNTVGGKEAYYKFEGKVSFDPFTLVGAQTKDGEITKVDAEIVKDFWEGPTDKNGNRLYCSFRPGVLFWNNVIPVGGYYYSLFSKRPKPFIITTHYARWLTKTPNQKFDKITLDEFYDLFSKSVTEFASSTVDNVDLSPFYGAGGKLIIDHGIDDPLIPVDGTIDYYKKVCEHFGDTDTVYNFFRIFITPGDGHGECNWHGPGITESDGMTALINWAEKGNPPEAIRKVQVDKKGNTICEGQQHYFKF